MFRFQSPVVERRCNITRLLWGLIFVAVALFSAPNAGAREARANEVFVAAASSLRFALDALQAQYQDTTGVSIKISYGSSGDLVRQIQLGAPFEIFMSADESYAQRLIEQADAHAPLVRYAAGRIGFFVPPTSRLYKITDLDSLVAALSNGDHDTIAIANPDHAPYGRAGRMCLQTLGLWDRLADHIVMGENATQTTQFAISGQISGGVVPKSLISNTPIAAQGRFLLLPKTCHDPLHQAMVLTGKADEESRAVFTFLMSETARATFKAYGFDDPETGE